jgi:hypothetical protein
MIHFALVVFTCYSMRQVEQGRGSQRRGACAMSRRFLSPIAAMLAEDPTVPATVIAERLHYFRIVPTR